MYEIVIGLETEYGVTPFDEAGEPLDRTHYANLLVQSAIGKYAALAGFNRQDLYLASGSRLYVDAGLGLVNLECSTAECRSPQAVVAYSRAGDRMIAGLARELVANHPELHEVFISKTNFDYCGHTSGSHENYKIEAPQAIIGPQLVPFLASRCLYSGGGGFNDRSQRVEFMISPRVSFLEQISSEGAQENRSIVNIRYEPLSCSAFGRLHLLCGEGNRYGLTEYLRFGATALVVCLIDAGFEPARDIEINPMAAINTVARDLRCREKIGQVRGRSATAIDIQRHYLEQVEAQLGKSLFPGWAVECCRRWREVLAILESNPMNLVGVIDWPTKLALYRDIVESGGYDWDQLAREVDESFAEIRTRLFEYDIRFGDIADDRAFTEPGNAAQIVDDRQIETALHTPPQDSRARLRGKWIARLRDRFDSYRCSWEEIHDARAGRSLRFDDPLGTEDVNWVNT
jgi:proteasome accessory factor A